MPPQEEALARLRLICGERYVLSSPSELAAYTRPGQPVPTIVVLPGTATEVAASVRACNAAQLAVAPRGAASHPAPTAAVGAAAAARASAEVSTQAESKPLRSTVVAPVVIALTRLRRLPAIDLAAGSVTADAGVPLATVRRALPPALTLLPDLPQATVRTIGGALAAGAGLRALLELDVVTATGALVRIDRSAPGYDLAGAFIGSRGQSGIAVRVRLRLSARETLGVNGTMQPGDSAARSDALPAAEVQPTLGRASEHG